MPLRQLLLAVIFAGLGVAVVTLAITWIPRPEKAVDYLELPEAIVVQYNTRPAAGLGLEFACDVPDFTLYGDGTAIFTKDGTVQTAKLTKSEVLDLIAPIVDEGFMDYDYTQVLRDPGDLGSATFLYIHTQDAANAVGMSEITIKTPTGPHKNIVAFLDRVDALAAGSPSQEFSPETQQLIVAAWDGPEPGSTVPWTGAADLEALGSTGNGDVKTEKIDALAPAQITPHPVTQNGRTFLVCTRPILPYEENFPEFDDPSP